MVEEGLRSVVAKITPTPTGLALRFAVAESLTTSMSGKTSEEVFENYAHEAPLDMVVGCYLEQLIVTRAALKRSQSMKVDGFQMRQAQDAHQKMAALKKNQT